ncbi:gll0778 [Gloeobacter violaceus PCC 7421]|uniref:Gll0778 protein n=2 Tax=Gloeobacter violaceus TaxID=33072 RepID=Q7NMI7_GLOVI|nr:gll0778 [Gloeobacter violaceus PCC 7421]
MCYGTQSMTGSIVASEYLKSADGLRLHITRWDVNEPFGTLLVLPGKGEHGGRYGQLAAGLAACGWQTWGLDPRGQGLSDGARSRIGSYDEFLTDIAAALEALGREFPGRPAVVLGYSMGAVTGVLAALRWPERIQGLICVSPAFVIDNRLRGLAKVFAYLGSWLFPQRIVASGYNPAAVTNCPLEQQQIAADPLIDGTTRPRLVVELHKAGAQCLRLAPRLAIPTLILATAFDRIVDARGAQAFYDRLPGDRTLHWYDDQLHDLLHERRSAEVTGEITGWLRERWPGA